jgi:hypothetical protein
MASSPATNAVGVELQAAGENLNTWGNPKLTNSMQVMVNLSTKFHTLAMSGDTTVSETNYSTTNTTEVAVLKLTGGSLSAAANLVVPARDKRWVIWNNESYTITVKLSATTGVALPAGRWALITTDGSTDVYNHSPNHMGTAFTPSLDGDVANVKYVSDAITALIGATTAGLVLVSAGDTTSSYLNSKITVSGGISKAITSAGGNEGLQLTSAATDTYAVTDGGTKTSGFTAAINTRYHCIFGASGTITGPSSASNSDVLILALASNAIVYTFDPNGLKMNGLTVNQPLPSNNTWFLTYDTANGWV